MQGLGDNIYQRAFVKQLSRSYDVYLETSWPQLYADLPIHVVRPNTRLRTQAKNIARCGAAWAGHPTHHQRRVSYVNAFRHGRSIINGMEETLGIALDPADFDLPPLPPPPITTDKPIAFVRPVTARKEWLNLARNPEPQYLADVVEYFRPTHHIVTVADIAPPDEWLIGSPIKANTEFIRGELKVMDMLALLAASDIVLGGVGFIVPASIALKRNCFVILGGNGAHAAPSRILDQRRLDCSRIGFATPKDFCPCANMRHSCNKAIPDLMAQLCRFLDRSSIAPRMASCSGIPSMVSAISPS